MARRTGFLLLGLAAITAGALLAPACSKKPLIVSPGFTVPEGMPSNGVQLVIWPERPNILAIFRDLPPVGEGDEDEFLGFERSDTSGIGGNPVGSVNGMVLDNTAADGYQVFRRAPNGGLQSLVDFPLQPVARWLDGHWELYRFVDTAPTSAPSYIARGLFGGGPALTSPLSNTATLVSDTLYNITLTFPNDTQDLNSPFTCPDPHNRPCAGNDSTVTWQSVPGATSYLVQIYQLNAGSGNQIILSGRPALLDADKLHYFVVGGTQNPVSFGINQAFPGSVLTGLPTPHLGQYLVRVSALGSHGDLRGVSYVQCESFGTAVNADDPSIYAKFPLAAVTLPHFSLNDQDKKSCTNRNAALTRAYAQLLGGSPSASLFRGLAFMLRSNPQLAGHHWIFKGQ